MALPATLVWEVETTGSDTNGGAFDPSVTSPGTDYTYGVGQAVFSYTDLVIGATTTQLTSVARPFIAADVGNTLQIVSGTGFTVGFYSVRSVAAGVATMDRSVGTATSTGGTGNIGGALATISKAASVATVQGNLTYVKAGTGYSITAAINMASNYVAFVGYASTRGDNGKVIITVSSSATSVFNMTGSGNQVSNFILDANSIATQCIRVNNAVESNIFNCLLNNFVTYGLVTNFSIQCQYLEITAGNSGSTAAIFSTSDRLTVLDCYIHDTPCAGIVSGNHSSFIGNIIANCSGTSDGIAFNYSCNVIGNTIYNCGRDGVRLQDNGRYPLCTVIQNNILASCGGYGLNLSGVSGNLYPGLALAANYNAYYSNTSGARNNVSAGSNDVTLTLSPFTNPGTGDFSLNSTAGGGAACRAAGIPGVFPGGLTTGYLDIGAAQHLGASVGLPVARII